MQEPTLGAFTRHVLKQRARLQRRSEERGGSLLTVIGEPDRFRSRLLTPRWPAACTRPAAPMSIPTPSFPSLPIRSSQDNNVTYGPAAVEYNLISANARVSHAYVYSVCEPPVIGLLLAPLCVPSSFGLNSISSLGPSTMNTLSIHGRAGSRFCSRPSLSSTIFTFKGSASLELHLDAAAMQSAASAAGQSSAAVACTD